MNQDIQEFDLPVASTLTPDYFTYDPTNGHSKKVIVSFLSFAWMYSRFSVFRVATALNFGLVMIGGVKCYIRFCNQKQLV